MPITRVAADLYRVPLARSGRVPLRPHAGATPGPSGVGPATVDVVAVTVEADGVTGLGLAVVLGPGGATVRQLVESDFAPLVTGANPRDTDRLFAKASNHFAGVGFHGLPARAYSAIDVALWDIQGKLAGLPVWRLLGGSNPGGAGYFASDPAGSGWDAADVASLARSAMKQGAMGVRVEAGTADVQADADRVRELHDALGEDAWVGVSGGGRYDLATALALAHFFEDQGVDWLEDPLPPGDTTGYRRLADRLELPIAVGSLFDRPDDFTRVIRDGLARIIRPDLGRLGGLTPMRRLVAVAEAFHVAVSPVRLPEINAHLGAGLAGVSFVDAVPWLNELVTGGPTPVDGKLAPGDAPGFGLTLNPDAAARYQVKAPGL